VSVQNPTFFPLGTLSLYFTQQARGLASRHVIDRLQEKQYLEQIKNVAPQLRSAVELLSKPDADYLYPPVQFVVNELRSKYPQVYDSVVSKVNTQIFAL